MSIQNMICDGILYNSEKQWATDTSIYVDEFLKYNFEKNESLPGKYKYTISFV